MILSLEEVAPFDFAWAGIDALTSAKEKSAAADAAVCAFLIRHNLKPNANELDRTCNILSEQDLPVLHQDSEIRNSNWKIELARKQRMQWALELTQPLPGIGHYLGSVASSRGNSANEKVDNMGNTDDLSR